MPKPQTKEEIAKDTCFVIGNGESRLIWKDWNSLKGKGTIYGCNAITRDYPKLCDKIFVQRCDFTNHIKQEHEGKRAYNCTLCKASYSHKHRLSDT